MALVSIIIPTYNRLQRLKQVIAALENQEYPLDNIEVVIISDGSTDGTDAYLSNLKSPLNLIFVPQANAGPAAARNSGIKHASSEYVLFIDDDVVPSPRLIIEHMQLHALQANLIVLGPMLNPSNFTLSPWVAWEQSMLEKQYRSMQSGKWTPTARQFYTGNTSLARRHLSEIGGFDERFRRAEDVELAYRLSSLDIEFVFNPQAIGYHYAERSLRSWMETPYTYGRNDVIFMRERQPWLLSAIREEFSYRNRLTRILVWICVGRPIISHVTQRILRSIADGSSRMQFARICQASYSAIFNLRYYQGMADELGGRANLFNLLEPSTATMTTKK
jgi:GT2 family glycosyltransferase